MTDLETSVIRELWSFSDRVYKDTHLLYFVCSSEFNFANEVDKKLGIELGELPDSISSPGLDSEKAFVYSYEHRGNHSIIDVGNLLNTKLPNFVDKGKSKFLSSIETTLLYKTTDDNELELISSEHPAFKRVLNLFELLSQLSSYVSIENSKFVFWINSTTSSGKSTSRIVEFTFDSNSISRMFESAEELRLPSFDGPHSHDKVLLFKRALTESLSDCEKTNATMIIDRLERIDGIFDSEFAAYVNKFGLDKSLNELYDKLNDIIGKIFDAIQGTALKLLIVPGTMLATIFMRQREASDWKIAFILIAVGVLVYLLHFETKKYIDKIAQNGQRLLDTIININSHDAQSENIEKPQQEVKEKLKESAYETKQRITYYLYGSLLALAMWVFIIFWEKLSPYLNKASSIISNFISV